MYYKRVKIKTEDVNNETIVAIVARLETAVSPVPNDFCFKGLT
jgi:hypothetical protein